MISSRSDWRGVRVPPPDSSAAIGGALRHAFPVDETPRSLEPFADQLARLRDRR